jgi:hypothetical protein
MTLGSSTLKNRKTSSENEQNTLYRVYHHQIRQQGTLDESENTINNQAQVNAYESLFQTLTQKKWFAGGFAWKWYADDYHKREKC